MDVCKLNVPILRAWMWHEPYIVCMHLSMRIKGIHVILTTAPLTGVFFLLSAFVICDKKWCHVNSFDVNRCLNILKLSVKLFIASSWAYILFAIHHIPIYYIKLCGFRALQRYIFTTNFSFDGNITSLEFWSLFRFNLNAQK